MRSYRAIVQKELHALFVSPIAYVVLAVFFLVTGFYFFFYLTGVLDYLMQQGLQAQQFGGNPPPFDAPGIVMQGFFGIVSFVLLLLLPMVTMGSFSEEKKSGTIELLLTSPVTHLQVILGKFTAFMLFLFVMLTPTILNTVLLYVFSDPLPPLAPMLLGYLGAFLLGGSLLAFGLFFSSLTENQIVAVVVTFCVFMILWVIDFAAGTASTLTNETLRYLSVLKHYEDFTRGILDTQHLVFYFSLIFLGLFLTSVSLDSLRWRQ
ncbi:MAG: ABC transporter permease [Acidobacteriota bacterium]